MRSLRYFSAIAILLCCITALSFSASSSAGIPRISKEQARTMLGKPDVVFVDVRSGSNREDAARIKGAIREDPKTIENWFSTFPKKKTLIFYCA